MKDICEHGITERRGLLHALRVTLSQISCKQEYNCPVNVLGKSLKDLMAAAMDFWSAMIEENELSDTHNPGCAW